MNKNRKAVARDNGSPSTKSIYNNLYNEVKRFKNQDVTGDYYV